MNSYANLTVFVNTSTDCRPKFQSAGSIVLNNPEVLRVNDILATVEVVGCDNDTILNYSIIGPYRDWFWIDSQGRLYLLQPLFTNFDDNFYFNLTLSVSDKNGFSDFTDFIIFINTTSSMILEQSIFSATIDSYKSELSLSDNITLLPPLDINVRHSIFLRGNFFTFAFFVKGKFNLYAKI